MMSEFVFVSIVLKVVASCVLCASVLVLVVSELERMFWKE